MLTESLIDSAFIDLASIFTNLTSDPKFVVEFLLPEFSPTGELPLIKPGSLQRKYNEKTLEEYIVNNTNHFSGNARNILLDVLDGFEYRGVTYFPSIYFPNADNNIRKIREGKMPFIAAGVEINPSLSTETNLILGKNKDIEGNLTFSYLSKDMANLYPVFIINWIDKTYFENVFSENPSPHATIDPSRAPGGPAIVLPNSPGSIDVYFASLKIEEPFEESGNSEVNYRVSVVPYQVTQSNPIINDNQNGSGYEIVEVSNNNIGTNVNLGTPGEFLIDNWPSEKALLAITIFEYDWYTGNKTYQNGVITHTIKPKFRHEVYFTNLENTLYSGNNTTAVPDQFQVAGTGYTKLCSSCGESCLYSISDECVQHFFEIITQ